MSTTFAPATRPPLTRLTRVELRKMTDTRAGSWLLIAIGVLMVAIVATVGIVGDDGDHALDKMLAAAVSAATLFLPVVGILLVTSEWSQRTTLITFTVVPERTRILVAKLLAGILLALGALAAALAVAMVATVITGGEWTLPPGLVGQTGVALAAGMTLGIAFGAVIQSPAPAIVVYFVLPTAIGALGTIKALHSTAGWLDTNQTLHRLTEHLLSGTEWARIGTSLAVFLVVPLAVGAWRIAREDIQ